MRTDLSRTTRSGLSGLAATFPMTAVLLGAESLGLLDELPPTRIVRHLLPGLDDRAAQVLAAAAHAGYGAAAGAALGALAPASPLRRRATIAWALAVYLASYQGWVPVAGVLPPAIRDRRGRVLSIVLAHVVWGAALRVRSR